MGRSQDEQNMGRRDMKRERERKKGEEVGWWLRGVGGGKVEGRVYLIGDPGGTPLPEA